MLVKHVSPPTTFILIPNYMVKNKKWLYFLSNAIPDAKVALEFDLKIQKFIPFQSTPNPVSIQSLF